MRNSHQWKPSKYVVTSRGLAASRDPAEVSIRSRAIVDRAAAAYEAALRSHARGALVDIGCGMAPLYGVYCDLVESVTCIDWPNTYHPNPFLDREADLNLGIPLPDSDVDTVVATDVLEHLWNPGVFWSEVARILRPAGKVVLGVPFLYGLHEEPFDYHRYTAFSLRRFCQENGLTLVTLEPYAGPLAVLLDILGKHVPGRIPATLYQGGACGLLRSGLGQWVDRKNRQRFPLGYCLVAQRDGA